MGDDDLTAKEAVDLGRRVSERRRTTHVRLPDPVDRNIDRVEKSSGSSSEYHSAASAPSSKAATPMEQIDAMSAFAVSTSMATKRDILVIHLANSQSKAKFR